MLQQLILSVFLVISSISLCADPINLEINLPPEFTIEPHLFSTTAFDLQTKDDRIGTIVRTFFNSSTEYNYYNTKQQLQAKAKERFFFPGVIFDVFDEKNTPIGRVEVKLNGYCSSFALISPTDEILAQASLNFWNTCYTFTSPLLGETVATLSRPYFCGRNTWTINVVKQEAFNEGNIDPRLLIIAAAFHSDKRHWKAAHTPEVVYINTSHPVSCFPIADEAPAITQVSELMQEELSEIEKELETHREELIEIVPSQEEFEETEVITIPYLKKMDEYIAVDEVSRFESFKEDCRSLLQLFDDSVLTLRQKKALYLMLEERLKDLKN